MKQPTLNRQAANILLLICLPVISQAEEIPAEPLRLRVQFQNYGPADAWLLRGAAEIAEQVYREARIEIEWADCTPALSGKPAPVACTDPMSPTSIVVQFPTKRMVKGVPVAKGVFGYAVPAGPGKFATRASLFYDRILSYSTAHGLSAKALLGMALAHEIGHLLLGRDSHSEHGLMSCPWSKEDIVEAARGRLAFEPTQLAQVRRQALARAGAEQAAAVSAD